MSDFLLRLDREQFIDSLEGDDLREFKLARTKKHPALPAYYSALAQLLVETAETLHEQSALERSMKRVDDRIQEIESCDVNEIWIVSEELFGRVDFINGPVFFLKGQIPIFLSFHDFEEDPWLDA